jgi:hypothetical protein
MARGRFAGVHFSQPGFLPENHATPLAFPMISAGAVNCFQKHHIVVPELAHFHGAAVVANLFRPSEDTKLPSAKFDHLRHERQPMRCSILIQSRQYLGWTANFNNIAGKKHGWFFRSGQWGWFQVSVSRAPQS